MNYSINLKANFTHYDDPRVGQVILPFDTTHIQEILHSYDKFPNKTIVIDIADISDFHRFDMFNLLDPVKNRTLLRFQYWGEDDAFINDILERDFRFGFLDAITTAEDLYDVLQMGATDVLIAGQIAFDLKDVSALAREYGADLRVMPNVAQAARKKDETSFFITPYGVDEYEGYIDYFEFYDCMNKGEVLFNIYANKKDFKGDLSLVIDNLDCTFPLHSILEGGSSTFDRTRTRCGQVCKLGKCQVCTRWLNMAKITAEMDEDLSISLIEDE